MTVAKRILTYSIFSGPISLRRMRRFRTGAFLLLFLSNQAESAEVLRLKETLPGLVTAQTILIETQIIPAREGVDGEHVLEIVTHRMEELGYTVVTNQIRSHDVVVEVTCKKPTVEKNGKTPSHTSDLDLLGREPFIGPPCLFEYRFQGKSIPWQRVDRIIYSDGVNTAKQIASRNPTVSTSDLILPYLKQFEFPLLLSAEWGQTHRLIQVFQEPGTSIIRKKKIMTLLGETQAEQAFPLLVDSLKNQTLVTAAARALGHFGETARPYLTSLLETSSRPEIQAAAANGLGRVGALTGDTSSTSILLKVLTAPGADRRVQTEVVWALGKAPDFEAFPALVELEREIWLISSPDTQIQKLRQAVDWSIREVRQGGHTDDY